MRKNAADGKTLFCDCETPLGTVRIEADSEGIRGLRFMEEGAKAAAPRPESPLLEAARTQLQEYFAGERTEFDLPLSPRGTDFQKKVWAELARIPYGETRSYQQIAAAVGNETAARAVGMANPQNPVAIIVPCHRVIGKNGALTGYAGGPERKKALLALEAAAKKKN